jgi:hypothetical protein
MKVRSAVIASVLVVLEGVAAFGLGLMSVHGPSAAAPAAPIYFFVALGLTWWVARRSANLLPLIGTGVLPIALAPALLATLDRIDAFQYDRRIAGTQVSNVGDEPILSASGRPIGIRISYTVSVPGRGYFGITPSLYGGDPRNERLSVGAMRWTIDGVAEPKPFEPNKRHAMVVELYPTILFLKHDERCLSTAQAAPIPDGTTASPLRIVISETRYGDTYRGGQAQLTRNAYDVAELYRGVLSEGLKPCT